jgi:thiamine-phosphate pyrophosphorylase
MPTQESLGLARRARLAQAQLYLVCAAKAGDGGLPALLRAAIAGGVDVFQLREKQLPDAQLTAVAKRARALCGELGALFIVNDRPDLAREVVADGVHVGQDDMPATQVRELVGAEMLIGVSTHSPREIDAIDPVVVDYIGVGPIHATPTKPARPAVGVELIDYAAAHSPVPFFAIGGLHAGNLADARAAGASRACVLRAITEAQDPERSARELCRLLAASG